MKEVTIYTRGLSAASGMGSYGVVLLYTSHRKELCGSVSNSSNNRMDILAAVEGLRALKYPCNVTLYSTNTYLTDAISKNWIQRIPSFTGMSQPFENMSNRLKLIALGQTPI